jgi:chemotaxis-related protein WspD
MSNYPNAVANVPPALVNACWTTIGVRGDGSCPELKQYVHCRNCPVYSAGAMQVLESEVPVDDLGWRTYHFARPKQVKELDTQSIVIFRVGSEWLALPAPCVTEVANLRPIHSLPHRPSGVVLGLASVRGELLICVSIGHMLGLEPSVGVDQKVDRTAHPRLLVIRHEQVRAVCPVDEVHGIHRFHPRELMEVPATIARATATYSKALLSWHEHSVGLLDDELVFGSLKRSVA